MARRAASTPSGRTRAARFALLSTITIVALTAACILAVLIAGRYKLRLDVTATGEHSLAPRTLTLLESLDQPVNIVLSANLQRLDRRTRQRIDDALSAFADASPELNIMRIDTGSPGAPEAYATLITDLALRDAADIDAATGTTSEALGALSHASVSLADLAQRCRDVASSSTDDVASQWNEAGGVLDALATELTDTIEKARSLASASFGSTTLPQPDAVLQTIDPVVQKVGRALAALQAHASKASGAGGSSPARQQMSSLGDASYALLQDIADALDHLRRAPRLDALDIARLLTQREAIVVVGPERTSAVDFDALFPAASVSSDTEGASLVFAGEDLIATAISSATRAAQPAVILVHAETDRIFDDSGEPTKTAAPALAGLVGELRRRQIGVGEWPVALDEPMPTRASLSLREGTPVVWFVLDAPPSTASGGVDRISKLADAIARLADRGESILLTIDPSDLPSVGEKNPIIATLPEFGLESRSGRVIISRLSTPTGPQFMFSHTLRRADTASPIGAALDGLATLLPTPTPITINDAPDASAWPILSIDASETTWAEARWQGVVAQRVSEPPTPDAKQDTLDGPFHVVVAAERRRAPTEPASIQSGSGGVQRLVAVAARSWYVDPIAAQRVRVEGREAARYPGNRELLSTAITWLAGQDELIARSPDVARVARIKPLTNTQVTAIRWFLIAGMPALVLAIGAALRLVRR